MLPTVSVGCRRAALVSSPLAGPLRNSSRVISPTPEAIRIRTRPSSGALEMTIKLPRRVCASEIVLIIKWS